MVNRNPFEMFFVSMFLLSPRSSGNDFYCHTISFMSFSCHFISHFLNIYLFFSLCIRVFLCEDVCMCVWPFLKGFFFHIKLEFFIVKLWHEYKDWPHMICAWIIFYWIFVIVNCFTSQALCRLMMLNIALQAKH